MKPIAFALALLLAGGISHAATAEPKQVWEISMFSWVKRRPAEPGAPANGQPLRVDPIGLGRALAAIRCRTPRGEALLFLPDEALELGRVLAEALGVAGPGEDLELVSTAKREGFFGKSQTVTARVFAREGRVNLLFRDLRLDAVSTYHLDYQMPRFEVGTRAKASTAEVRASGAESIRADWLVLPPGAEAPAVRVPPPPPAAPKPASASVDERLRHLKRIREENLITEEEYARRKAELLKEI